MKVVELLALVLLMIQIDYCSLTEPSENLTFTLDLVVPFLESINL